MRKFNVQIKETLVKTVTVEAESAKKAREIVEKDWKDSIHILDADCFEGVVFTVPMRQERER
ncbi:MAG: DpnD/PcfM family protein [Clostridiales bacterium]|jgi:hypothetical protein|nr:DpnD/PcfM family protein [Clostridiales bacterium]